jgi:hypothetical protein
MGVWFARMSILRGRDKCFVFVKETLLNKPEARGHTGRCKIIRHWDNRDCEGPEWENEWFETVMMYDSPLSLSGVYIRVGMAVMSDRERSVCLSRPEIIRALSWGYKHGRLSDKDIDRIRLPECPW